MKAFDLLENMGEISDHYILEAYDMKRINTKKALGKTVRLMRLAAVLAVLLLAVTAYALTDYLGILDMYRGTQLELPSEAAEFVETQSAEAASEDWSCRITESLLDGARVLVTVQVDGGDKYVIAPTFCSASDSVAEIGLPRGKTLGEYAAEQGKKLLFVSASLDNWDDLKSQGELPRDEGNGKMSILIDGDLMAVTETLDTTCTVYARLDGEEEVQRVSIPVQFTGTPVESMGIFRAEDPDAIPGIHVEELELKQTPLGMTVEYAYQVTDVASLYEIMKQDSDEITSYHGGGAMLGEDGMYHCTWTACQGEVNDTLTIHYYDWNKDLIGSIVFRRVE